MLSYSVASLRGFPPSEVIALACTMTGNYPGSRLLLSAAVVDAMGHNERRFEVERNDEEPQADTEGEDAYPMADPAADDADELARTLSGKGLVVVFDKDSDLAKVRTCVPALQDVHLNVCSLKHECAEKSVHVSTLQELMARLGITADLSDVVACAKATSQCFIALTENPELASDAVSETSAADDSDLDKTTILPRTPIAAATLTSQKAQDVVPATVGAAAAAAAAAPALEELSAPEAEVAPTGTDVSEGKVAPTEADTAAETPADAETPATEEAPAAEETQTADAPSKTAKSAKGAGIDWQAKLRQLSESPQLAKLKKLTDSPAKLAAVCGIAVVCVATLVALIVGAANRKPNPNDPTATTADEQVGRTQTFFDAVVVPVPETWQVEEAVNDSAFLYTDDDGVVYMTHIDLANLYAQDEEELVDEVLNELEYDAVTVEDRYPSETRDLAGAVRRRYPTSFMLDSENYGGYLDVTMTDEDAYAVAYVYQGVYPEDVEGVVCEWLDQVEYLTPSGYDGSDSSADDDYSYSTDTSWIDGDLNAETLTFSYQGMSVELPDTWHQDLEGRIGDSFNLTNDHGCKAEIKHSFDSIDESDDFRSARDSFLDSLGDEYVFDEANIQNVTVGHAQGFAFTANSRGATKYACAFEVLFSGNDTYSLFVALPEETAEQTLPIAAHALQTVRLQDSMAPAFEDADSWSTSTSAPYAPSSPTDTDLDDFVTPSRPTTSSTPTTTPTTTTPTSTGRISPSATTPTTTPTTQTSAPSNTTTTTSPTGSTTTGSQRTQTTTSSNTTSSNANSSSANSSNANSASVSPFTQDSPSRATDDVAGTADQRNALQQAQSELEYAPYSRKRLIEQVESAGYSTDDAVWAVDQCGADWNEQATKKAQDCLDTSPFSHDALVDQLEYEGFTADEAEYGANGCGADWYDQASRKARELTGMSQYTHETLVDQLMFEGFTADEAEYGASSVIL